jgi:hypothetical protein
MTELPDRKRQADELKRLRLAHAMAARPPIGAIKSQMAHGFLLFLGYLLCLGGGLGGLAVALFIAVRKPRSRHHAALMFILAVLVLVFGIRYYLSQADAA